MKLIDLRALGRNVTRMGAGVPVAEAAGLEAVLKGLRESAANDDVLLAAVMPVFDGLYLSFKCEKP